MSWANCGEDKDGRPIGYAVEAECDFPGCHAEIDRGLSYACGGEHGPTEFSCDKYFCPDHLCGIIDDDNCGGAICDECEAKWIADHPEEEGEDK